MSEGDILFLCGLGGVMLALMAVIFWASLQAPGSFD